MDSMRDLLKKKADDIDIEKRKDESALVKEILSRHYPDSASLLKISDNRIVYIKINNAPLASEIRMQQIELIEEINRSLDEPVKGLRTRLR